MSNICNSMSNIRRNVRETTYMEINIGWVTSLNVKRKTKKDIETVKIAEHVLFLVPSTWRRPSVMGADRDPESCLLASRGGMNSL